VTSSFAAAFPLVISIFNMVGRFVWSTASDYLGRQRIYACFFALGAALYASIPFIAAQQTLHPSVEWLIRVLRGHDADLHDVRRRLRRDPGLPVRPVWDSVRRWHSWSTVDGLEHGGGAGPVAITYLRERSLHGGPDGPGGEKLIRASSSDVWGADQPAFDADQQEHRHAAEADGDRAAGNGRSIEHLYSSTMLAMAGLLVIAFFANAMNPDRGCEASSTLTADNLVARS
jgi:hypothetical protein